MNRRLRTDIVKRINRLVFVNFFRRNFSGNNPAKQTGFYDKFSLFVQIHFDDQLNFTDTDIQFLGYITGTPPLLSQS